MIFCRNVLGKYPQRHIKVSRIIPVQFPLLHLKKSHIFYDIKMKLIILQETLPNKDGSGLSPGIITA